MVELSPKDSSILTRIARYRKIPQQEREQLLKEASAKAREIGEIILGTSTGDSADEDTKQAAEAYKTSLQRRSVTKKAKFFKRK